MRHSDCYMLKHIILTPVTYIVQKHPTRTTAVIGYVYVREVWPKMGPDLLVLAGSELQDLVEL